jgi:hypothetical protein
MKPKFTLFAFALLTLPISLPTQVPFSTIDTVDINKISASVLAHGDMWRNPATGTSVCEYSKATSTLSYTTSRTWAKIWKVNRTQIDSFNPYQYIVTDIPAPILEWPAKGNPYATSNGGVPLTISTDMAPIVDVNNGGLYNHYPAIKRRPNFMVYI